MTTKHILLVIALLLSFSSTIFAQESETTAESPFIVQELSIPFADEYETKARLTLPSTGEAPYTTIILYHGSGPWDMNATNPAPDGSLLSENFALLSESLAEAGYAVLSYNKRGALGNGEYDMEQLAAIQSLPTIISDAESVLNFAQALPEVDTEAVYLYGWSEGAWVASHVAANHAEEVAGIILQAPPNRTMTEILDYQHIELGIPYLLEVTDTDGNGAINLEEAENIPAGPMQILAGYYIWGTDYDPENPQVNWYVDKNSDGELDVEGELLPIIEETMTMMASFDDGISRVVSDVLAESTMPILILHGELDGYVPLFDSESILEALGERVTLNTYEGLGHALSETTRPEEDSFGVMEDAPIQDLIAWLDAQ